MSSDRWHFVFLYEILTHPASTEQFLPQTRRFLAAAAPPICLLLRSPQLLDQVPRPCMADTLSVGFTDGLFGYPVGRLRRQHCNAFRQVGRDQINLFHTHCFIIPLQHDPEDLTAQFTDIFKNFFRHLILRLPFDRRAIYLDFIAKHLYNCK